MPLEARHLRNQTRIRMQADIWAIRIGLYCEKLNGSKAVFLETALQNRLEGKHISID